MNRSPEHTIPGEKVVYVKTGLGLGGATLSDLQYLYLMRELGMDIRVLSGWIDPRLVPAFSDFNLTLNTKLDRENKTVRASELVEVITGGRDEEDIVMFSQAFSRYENSLAEAASRVSNHYQTMLRIFDFTRWTELMTQFHPTTVALCCNEVVSERVRTANETVHTTILPPFIDKSNYTSSPERSSAVRAVYGIKEDDFVIFQPTRVDPNKRIDRAILLATELSRVLDAQKQVFVIVAGGHEPEERSIIERGKLEAMAKSIGFPNLRFAEGLNLNSNLSVGDYLHTSDLVTFMSEVEGWGIPPAESCIAGVPCLTTEYTDESGNPVFRSIYEGFRFIIEPDRTGQVLNPDTLAQVIELAHYPEMWGENRQINRDMVRIYSKENAVSILARLFRLGGVV